MFLARNTKKKHFERPKRLDPQKAENWENWLKRIGFQSILQVSLKAYCHQSEFLFSRDKCNLSIY